MNCILPSTAGVGVRGGRGWSSLIGADWSRAESASAGGDWCHPPACGYALGKRARWVLYRMMLSTAGGAASKSKGRSAMAAHSAIHITVQAQSSHRSVASTWSWNQNRGPAFCTNARKFFVVMTRLSGSLCAAAGCASGAARMAARELSSLRDSVGAVDAVEPAALTDDGGSESADAELSRRGAALGRKPSEVRHECIVATRTGGGELSVVRGMWLRAVRAACLRVQKSDPRWWQPVAFTSACGANSSPGPGTLGLEIGIETEGVSRVFARGSCVRRGLRTVWAFLTG